MVANRGWLYINGVFQTGLDFGAITEAGGIRVFLDDEHDGRTLVSDFSVWKWGDAISSNFPEVQEAPTPSLAEDPSVPVYGPEFGWIDHDPDDGFLEVFRGPVQSGDVMIEVTFKNPYAPNESHWNYGFFFDSAMPSTFHWIEVNSRKEWGHRRRSGPDSRDFSRGFSEDAPGVDVSEGGENHLRLIVIGDAGWLYVNDRFTGNVNFSLGDVPNPDRIGLVIADSGPGLRYKEGDVTRFEDFTVWRWHPSLFDLPDDD